MILKEKRSGRDLATNRPIAEYKDEDGVWHSAKDLHAMILPNEKGEVLTLASFHNRLSRDAFDNPDILEPKITVTKPTQNYNSGLAALSTKTRRGKLSKFKSGKFDERLNANNS